MVDAPGTDLSVYFEDVSRFIGGALAEDTDNKVFVHCFRGVSRSATLVLAYLMTAKQPRAMSATDLLEFVRSKRGVADPNIGFWRQLLRLEKQNGVVAKSGVS